MVHSDSRGLPLSTGSDLSAMHYRDGVDLMLSAWPGAAELVDAAIASDPDFALAHATRARLHAMRGESAMARDRIAVARSAARNATEREQSHIEVLAAAIEGRSALALERALAHLETWPRDVVIFSLPLGAFGLFAFSGMADHDAARVALCEKHAAHFSGDDWWFLTYRGWSHTENGDVARGRALSERSHALRPHNANGVHALSHAMFEAGDAVEAENFIKGWLPSYDRSGVLHGHLAWHGALGALARDDAQAALAVYAQSIQPSVSLGLALNIVSDSASLLWRVKAHGYAVPPNLWDEAVDYASQHFPRAGGAFADVHMAMLEAMTGRRDRLAARIAEIEQTVGASPASAVAREICHAISAFADEDYATCARLLEVQASEFVRIGGSGAQRRVFEDTLLLAHIRSGDTAKASALLDRRLHRRDPPL